MADTRKLIQLARRYSVAKARYSSLEKRAGVIEGKRTDLEDRAQSLFENLYSSKGQGASKKQRHAWNARYLKAQREAARLSKLEEKIYQQLKPLEEKLATLKDNMRQVKAGKKLNPGRRHLPGATAKQQRQYEHVLASERAAGQPVKDAKRIAAATVRKLQNSGVEDSVIAAIRYLNKSSKSGRIYIADVKDIAREDGYTLAQIDGALLDLARTSRIVMMRLDDPTEIKERDKRFAVNYGGQANHILYAKNPQSRGEKANRAQDARFRKSINAYLAHGWNFQKIKDRIWLVYGLTLESLDSEKAVFADLFKRSKWILYLNPARGGASSEKINNPYYLVTGNKKSVTKTHDLIVLKADRAKDALARGKQLYASKGYTSLKATKTRNPSAKDSAKWEKLWAAYINALKALDTPSKGANARMKQARLGKAEKAIEKFDPEAYRKYIVYGRRNPTKKAMANKQPSPAQLRARKKFAQMAKARSRAAKARRRNPSAMQTLKKAGRAAKTAARATLDAGSKLLGAGAKALKNPIFRAVPIHKKFKVKKSEKSVSLALRGKILTKTDEAYAKDSDGYKHNIPWFTDVELVAMNPHRRIKVKNSYIDLVIKGQAKKTPQGWKVGKQTIHQGKGVAKLASNYYLDKATGYVYSKRQRANPARVSVKQSSYRGKQGYLISGADNRGRKISVFVFNRATAEKLKAPLKSSDDARVSEILRAANPKRRRNPLSPEQIRTVTGSAQKQAKAQRNQDAAFVREESSWFRRWRALQPKTDWPEIDKLHREEYQAEYGERRYNPKQSKTTYKAEIFDDGFKIKDNHGHSSSKIIYNSHSERIRTAGEAKREAAQFMKLVREGVLPLKGNPKRRRNPERIWQVYGYNKTAKSAAQEFARTYWAEPRKLTGFKPDGTFKVVRGLRTYRVFRDGDLFIVEVISDPIMGNPRKRNLDHKNVDHPVEVTKHWRAGPPGYMTPWQRAHAAGQHQLFETGIKPATRRNPVKLAKFPTTALRSLRGDLQQTLKKTKGATARHVSSRLKAVDKELSKRNPTRKGMRKGYGLAKALERHDPYRKPMLRKAARRGKQIMRKVGRANPTAKQIRKKFAGRVGQGRDLYFPVGTPQGLAKLGRLTMIKTTQGTIRPGRRNPSGEVWLCSDTHGHLHIGSTTKTPLWAEQAQDLGHVTRVEYDETKPHLGYPNPITWFHKMGEESGRRPTLYADGKGGLRFRGGSYRITRRGIVN